mmetsp:Transcript_496/g.590  ORF Transcript_496/g.590 Transcript_496/m.590 type:complete len:729 (+) Transcript_496:203-2389(+)
METELWDSHPNILCSSVPPMSTDKEPAAAGTSSAKTLVEKEKWKNERYEKLLHATLSLDEPKITQNMVEMFSKPEMCSKMIDLLVLDNESLAFDGKNANDSENTLNLFMYERDPSAVPDQQIRFSYMVMCILTGSKNELSAAEDPEALIEADLLQKLLAKTAPIICDRIFDSFQESSHGSFYHICPVIFSLLTVQAESVYLALTSSNHAMKSSLTSMLNFVHYTDVSSLLIYLICPNSIKPTNISRLLGVNSHESTYERNTLWKFYRKLSAWNFLSEIVQRIGDKSIPVFHRAAVAEFFVHLVMNLARDTNGGEMLLQPLGHCPEIVATLVSVSCDKTSDREEQELRLKVLEVLLQITELSIENDILQDPSLSQNGADEQSGMIPSVPNQMASVKEYLHDMIESHFQSMCKALINTSHEQRNSQNLQDSLVVKYSAYQVHAPFTYYRLTLVRLLRVCLCSRPERLFDELPRELSRLLCNWLLLFPENSFYHNEFMKIFARTLKIKDSNHEIVKVLLQKNKLISSLIDYYQEESNKGQVKAQILYMLNMIRLMASSLSPSHHFLPQFLKSHTAWREFLPKLLEDTLRLIEPWDEKTAESLKVVEYAKSTSMEARMQGMQGINPLNSEIDPNGDIVVSGINLGSKFADELGFEGYFEFSGSEPSEFGSTNSKKKKKKKKRKGKKSTQKNLQESISSGNGEDSQAQTSPSEKSTLQSTHCAAKSCEDDALD